MSTPLSEHMDIDSEPATDEDNIGDDQGQSGWQRDLGRMIGNICNSSQSHDAKAFLRRWGRAMRRSFVVDTEILDQNDYEFVRFLLLDLQHAAQESSPSVFMIRHGEVVGFRNSKYNPSNILASLPSAAAARARLAPLTSGTTLSPTALAPPRLSHRHSIIHAPTPPSVPSPPALVSRVDRLRGGHGALRKQLKARRNAEAFLEPTLLPPRRSPPRSIPVAGHSLDPNALASFNRPHSTPHHRATPTVDEAAEAFKNTHLEHSLTHRGKISGRHARMYGLSQCECGNGRGGGGVWFA